MHSLQDTFQTVQGADRREDMGRIGPLGAPRLDPAARFAGRQEGVQKPLGGVMGEQAFPKIVQQREIEAGVVQVEAQGIFPIHAAAHGIGGLAVGESFNVLHDHNQRQAPGGHFHGAALRWVEISQELIGVERAELRAEVNIEIAFGKGGTHRSRCRIRNRWEGFGT